MSVKVRDAHVCVYMRKELPIFLRTRFSNHFFKHLSEFLVCNRSVAINVKGEVFFFHSSKHHLQYFELCFCCHSGMCRERLVMCCVVTKMACFLVLWSAPFVPPFLSTSPFFSSLSTQQLINYNRSHFMASRVLRGEEALLLWVQRATKGYPGNVLQLVLVFSLSPR